MLSALRVFEKLKTRGVCHSYFGVKSVYFGLARLPARRLKARRRTVAGFGTVTRSAFQKRAMLPFTSNKQNWIRLQSAPEWVGLEHICEHGWSKKESRGGSYEDFSIQRQ